MRRSIGSLNWIGCLIRETNALLFLVIGITVPHATAQQPQSAVPHPSTSFSAEDDRFPDAVPLPDCVRRLLASDRNVAPSLEYQHLSPGQLPESWFTASKRDLRQSAGTYFIVMGAGLMRGANINPFWIFLRRAESCSLLLSVGAHDLEILKTTTNGLPDVRVTSSTAVQYFEGLYRFNGRSYQEIKRRSQPIGKEFPSDFFKPLSLLLANRLSNQGARRPHADWCFKALTGYRAKCSNLSL
jgi:hypothetical protein